MAFLYARGELPRNGEIRRSLKTRDVAEARRLRDVLEGELDAYWVRLLAGQDPEQIEFSRALRIDRSCICPLSATPSSLSSCGKRCLATRSMV